ncbi:hypothetical protein EAG_08456 [Camponotus floridanus]|uniref:LITAF domain-containing protein n=1 Tax=Camponotus floridanus TaxID=104421 RepID=E1ZYW9_CAMFO|nr:hypothetical protein EAG_08456 [Camponotus floridanus]
MEIARREESLSPMPEGNCTDALYARRQTDNLSYRSSLSSRIYLQRYKKMSVETKNEAACFYKSQRVECKRNEPSQSGTLFPWITTVKIPDDKARAPKQPNNVFSTEVETWKYHDKSVRCPACGEKETPIIFKQQKFTSSRLAAFCLLGCWPFCFIPLLMSRGKSVRTLCPRCGYDYGVRADEMVCSPKCASSRGGQSDSATSQTRRLWTECSSSRMQLGYWDRQNHCSPCDVCSSNDYANEKRDRRRNLNETKAQERSESESDNRTTSKVWNSPKSLESRSSSERVNGAVISDGYIGHQDLNIQLSAMNDAFSAQSMRPFLYPAAAAARLLLALFAEILATERWLERAYRSHEADGGEDEEAKTEGRREGEGESTYSERGRLLRAAFECPGFFATVTVPISVLTSEEPPPPPSARYLRKNRVYFSRFNFTLLKEQKCLEIVLNLNCSTERIGDSEPDNPKFDSLRFREFMEYESEKFNG